MRGILFAGALADDHRPNASDNNMDGCFRLTCKCWLNIQQSRKKKTVVSAASDCLSNIEVIHGKGRLNFTRFADFPL